MEYKLYSVSDLCYLTGITRKTLFYYDKIGLLEPSVRQGIQKHKMYDEKQVKRLQTILKYRNAGLTILEVKTLLDDPNADRQTILNNVMERLKQEYEKKKEEIKALEELIASE